MKRYAEKGFCTVLLLLCMLSAALYRPVTANAKDAADKTVYAAFGDSIAAGYGLDGYSHKQTSAPPDSYQGLLGSFLQTSSANYAVSGSDSSDCIKLLNAGTADADLKKADLITLSIGSNDLLLPFIEIVMDYFEIDPDSIDASSSADGFEMPKIDLSDFMQYYQKSEALIAELSDHPVLHKQAAAFPKKLENILSILHQKAPNAEIYVTNIYNPFIDIPVIGALAENYISEINQAFTSRSEDYTLIDVYTPFSRSELTNIHFDMKKPADINLDPHPSIKGHKTIADLLISALQKAHAPKAAALRSVKSDCRHKLTASVKLPDGCDGYQILYSAAKKGSYKVLAAASKKTYTTNSAKLKSGKTYYIKVRSVKTIKGVDYYGKAGAAKKILIK